MCACRSCGANWQQLSVSPRMCADSVCKVSRGLSRNCTRRNCGREDVRGNLSCQTSSATPPPSSHVETRATINLLAPILPSSYFKTYILRL
ncbi:hypothetical protein CC80DRAFT_262657 [Byssothecium circinans]|uniref:Uncharacterized protein n=1 Tax=Byssothecium circinans TaxID=147558 RepID=A0A6A5UHY7_9PLEO|nr:hypothetical protein CC80DRAFT_262657 [Byssothecium circinans]